MTSVVPVTDLDRAQDLLRTLRGTLDDTAYETRLAAAVANGYRLLGVDNGDTLIAVLGYRITVDLCWGKSLYIDDLIVRSDLRGGGHGRSLIDAAKRIAKDAQCDHIRLCSGLRRLDAHRFYETHGFAGFSKQFTLSLQGS